MVQLYITENRGGRNALMLIVSPPFSVKRARYFLFSMSQVYDPA